MQEKKSLSRLKPTTFCTTGRKNNYELLPENVVTDL